MFFTVLRWEGEGEEGAAVRGATHTFPVQLETLCLISEKYSPLHCRITIVPVGHSETFLFTLFQDYSYSIDAVSPLLKNVIELRYIIMQKLEPRPGCTAGSCKAAAWQRRKERSKRRENCPRITLYIAAI